MPLLGRLGCPSPKGVAGGLWAGLWRLCSAMEGGYIAPRLQYAYGIIVESVRWIVERTKVNAVPPSKKLQSIAYHEAGHAVIAWQVKVRIKKLSIIPEEGSLGRLLHHPYFTTTDIDCDTSARSQRRIDVGCVV